MARFLNPFRLLSGEARAEHVAAYEGWLAKRDGDYDLDARTLHIREPRMAALEAERVEWRGEIDASAFLAAMRNERGVALDLRGEWLVAAAKASEGERYGVEMELAHFRRDQFFAGFDSPEIVLRVLLQEAYHTRLLSELCRTCGVPFAPGRPNLGTRWFCASMRLMPGWLRWTFVLAGECVGAALFRQLHAKANAFSSQPAVQDRLRRILHEILIDEVLHIAFLRAHLGPLGIGVARLLLPITAFGVLREVPTLRHLGCTPGGLLRDLARGVEIPSELGWLTHDHETEEFSSLVPAGA
ncbi:MAG TPA: hypothetical protein VFT98_03055 [Myxococcota bacterium]|nr:hypothetical protein [Myxococcota bacterium]